jgi:hypothetical protein
MLSFGARSLILSLSTFATVFQQMECDYTVGPPHALIKIGSPEPSVPIVRLFGVTAEGHSVLVKVYGVLPYFYVQVPIQDPKWAKLLEDKMNLCNSFRLALEVFSLFFQHSQQLYHHYNNNNNQRMRETNRED